MLCASASFILIQRNLMFFVLPCSVQPHITIALRLFPWFPQNLKGCFICMYCFSEDTNLSCSLSYMGCSHICELLMIQLLIVCLDKRMSFLLKSFSCLYKGISIRYFCVIIYATVSGEANPPLITAFGTGAFFTGTSVFVFSQFLHA